MKQFLVIVFLITASFSAKAQPMNFDETVDYINKLFKEYRGYYKSKIETSMGSPITKIEVEKNGKMTFYTVIRSDVRILYLLDVAEWQVSDETQNLIPFTKNHIQIGNFMMGANTPEAIPNRLKNALVHLSTLCVKEKDPFDN